MYPQPQQPQQPSPPQQPPPQQSYVTAVQEKQVGTAYIFLIFLGLTGAHQFYLGKTGRGLLYLFTFGLLGVGIVIDLFTLGSQTRAVNAQIKTGVR